MVVAGGVSRHVARCGQGQREARAQTFLALHGEVTTHENCQTSADGESQTRTAVQSRVACMCLHKGLEDAFDTIGRYANAVVFDHELGARFLFGSVRGATAELYATTVGRKLDGIANQVYQDLL